MCFSFYSERLLAPPSYFSLLSLTPQAFSNAFETFGSQASNRTLPLKLCQVSPYGLSPLPPQHLLPYHFSSFRFEDSVLRRAFWGFALEGRPYVCQDVPCSSLLPGLSSSHFEIFLTFRSAPRWQLSLCHWRSLAASPAVAVSSDRHL